MDEEKKMGVTFNGSVTFNGPMFDIHDNQQVIIVNKTKADEKAHPMTITDKEIKIAIEELLNTKENGKPVFYNKKQWWAVFRVLKEYKDYPQNMTSFVNKIKELGCIVPEEKQSLTYDSLSKASNNVPKMACSPSVWGTLKDISDDYMQMYVVADFLMRKLGIIK